MKRVFHPLLDAWYDVADSAHEEWLKAGWLPDKPADTGDAESEPEVLELVLDKRADA